jgi:methionyl-tRNA formyltransferase
MSSMKVLFVTQNDPMYVRLLFEEFFAQPCPDVEVAGVVIAPAMGKKGLWPLVKQMYGFYGPVDFVRVGFRYVLCKLRGRLPASLRGSRAYTIEQACQRAGVAVEHVPRLNDREFVDSIRARKIDLLVSVAAPQIFKQELIEAPLKGCINIHNSKLPKYRGMMPNFWQMLHGETEVGTTVHRINASLDDGAILAQILTPLRPGESLDSVIRRTKHEGGRLLRNTLMSLARGQVIELPNSAAEGSYFSFPTPDDVRKFRGRGLRML